MKTNIKFYEVLSKKGDWRGNYSIKFDGEINVGCSGFQMARINAKSCDGTIYSVTEDGIREMIFPTGQ